MAEKDAKLTTPAAPVTPAAATPAPAVKPAAAPASPVTPAAAAPKPEATKAQVARMKLDEITVARKRAAEEIDAAERAKKEAEPLVGKAKEFDEELKKFAEDPATFLERFGIDRNTVTEKLAAKAIEEVRSKTPDGRIDELQKQLDEMKTKEEEAKKQVATRAAAEARTSYVGTLTKEALNAEKYPHAFRALSKMGEGAGAYLWSIGKTLFEQSAKDVPEKDRGNLPAPTAESIAKEVESYFADLAATLAAPLPGADGEKKPEQTGSKSADQLKAEALERKKAKEAEEKKPVGVVKKPASTLAERKAAALANLKAKSA